MMLFERDRLIISASLPVACFFILNSWLAVVINCNQMPVESSLNVWSECAQNLFSKIIRQTNFFPVLSHRPTRSKYNTTASASHVYTATLWSHTHNIDYKHCSMWLSNHSSSTYLLSQAFAASMIDNRRTSNVCCPTTSCVAPPSWTLSKLFRLQWMLCLMQDGVFTKSS